MTTFNPADKSTPGYYGPSQTALLLLDWHSMFVERLGGAQAAAALKVAVDLRTWAKSQGIQVIHCLVGIDTPSFPTCKGVERLGELVAGMKAGGGDKEPPELLEGGGDITFTRTPGHVSALKSPGLDDFLRKKNISSLILTGLSTSGCVTRTSFAACDAEYVVTVISDACADPGEGVHDMMVGKVLNSRGYVTTGAEYQEGFAKATGVK